MAEVEYYQGALTGEEIDALPNRLGNRNLVDNGYFANLYNQRGQTVYTGKAPFFDRWQSTNARATVTIQNGYINFACASGGNAYLRQPLEGLPAGLYTVSALVRGTGSGTVGLTTGSSLTLQQPNAIFTVNDTENWTLVTATATLDDAPNTLTIRSNDGSSIDILAVKAECGGSQSLAYQLNGAWILNDIPDIAAERLKCYRHYLKLSNTVRYPTTRFFAGAIDFIVPIPTMFRGTPTLDGNYTVYKGTAAQTGFTFSIYGYGPNALAIRATKASHGITPNDGCWLYVDGAALNAEVLLA